MNIFLPFKIALITACCVASVDAAPRKVVGENFTATWCTYCPDVANGLILLQNEFPDSFYAIQVHGGDAYSTNWGNARQSFYGVPGYPTVWMDGMFSQVGSYGSPSANYSQLRALYMNRQSSATDVTMGMCGIATTSDTYTVSINVGVEAGGTGKTMRVHCAQVIHNYPSNPNFNYACFMQGNEQDITVNAGETAIVDFTFSLNSESMARLNDVSFITWAQSTNSSGPSEVYQAEKHEYNGGDCQIDQFIVGSKGSFDTISDAIDACGTGDSILVMPGTYYENIDFGGRGISIQSTGGAELTILDGGGAAAVVRMYGEPDNGTILDGFTLQNGNSPLGGGIVTDGSSVITNCIIRNNVAQFGGGMYHVENGTVGAEVSNSYFCNNCPDDIYGAWVDAGGNIFDDACDGVCIGDISGDGNVGVTDVLAIIDAWETSNSTADLNADGIVNVIDLLMVVGAWGPCS